MFDFLLTSQDAAPGSRAIVSRQKLSQLQENNKSLTIVHSEEESEKSTDDTVKKSDRGLMVLFLVFIYDHIFPYSRAQFISVFQTPSKRSLNAEKLLYLVIAGKMVLPFEPLTVLFKDVQYYVDPPLVIKQSNII